MKPSHVLATLVLVLAPLGAVASCSGDPAVAPAPPADDAQPGDAPTTDAGGDSTPVDAPIGLDANDAPTDTSTADTSTADAASDAGDDATTDAGDDAAADAATDSGVDAGDAGDPLCEAAASDFEPGAVCGQVLPVTIQCTHTITQSVVTGTCCTPKNPGMACDGNNALCCADAGTYCGLVSSANRVIAGSLRLTRGSRQGTNPILPGPPLCGARTTPSSTKVTIGRGGADDLLGIMLALRVYELAGCSNAQYQAYFTRSDTADVYAGTWRDHPTMSNNRDSSGQASVTIAAGGEITLAAKGTVLRDTGIVNQITRRTHVGDCTATYTP